MARSAVFRWLMVSFILGIGAESFIAVPIIFVWIMGMSAIVLFANAWRKGQRYRIIYALCILGMLAGVVRMNDAKRSILNVSALSEQHVKVIGVVKENPILSEVDQRLLLSVHEVQGNHISPPFSIILIMRKYPSYQQGDIVRVQGVFQAKPYNGVISGVLFSNKEEKIGEKPISFIVRLIHKTKAMFNAQIDAVLPEPHAGFMKGLLLGERSTLPASLLEQFKHTGTSHIIALSGYNITIIGTSLVSFLLLVTVSFRVSFWIAGSLIIYFVLVTGASSSLVRAAIMGMLVLIAQREGRFYHMTNALIFAGAAMVFYNPHLLRFDISFQLSFLATIGLVFLSPMVEQGYYRTTRVISSLLGFKQTITGSAEHIITSTIRNTFIQTVAAQLAVLPLIIYLFGDVSLLTPITNLLILPVIPYTMLSGFFAGGLGLLWQPIGIMFGWISWVLLEYQLRVIELFAQMPFSLMSVPTAGFWIVMICYIAGAVIRLRKKIRDRL